jgi:hypothetical protein
VRAARGWLVAAALAAALSAPSAARAQLTISGEIDALSLGGRDLRGLNRNFRNDSPFSQIRLRLFGQDWVTPRIGVFTELLFDIAATAPRVNGAYVVVNEIAKQGWLNARVGMIPSPIGNYGLRDTYFNADPVVGAPLPWQHRSTLDGTGLSTNEDLIRRRQSNLIGLPIVYLACWLPTWELMGDVGKLEYSVSATTGSYSNMSQMDEKGVTGALRLGLEPISGVRFGVSAAKGPWIGGAKFDPLILAKTFPGRPQDYDQRLVGYDLEVSYGKVRLYSEAFASDWQVPLLAEKKLSAWSGYGELSYDFLPQWQVAVRPGVMRFSKISSTNDGLGPKAWWDDNTAQVEAALSYRLAREVIVRGDWQHTSFTSGSDKPINLFAAQIKAVF